MTTVAIYTRLSSDKSGEQTATSRQRTSCLAFAELRGWNVGRVYEDVDLSAYKAGVVRPDFERMLRDLGRREVDGVVAWKLDRLVRRSADFERLWGTCDRHGAFLASAMEPIDTSTDLGLAIVRVLVAFATLESATSGTRLSAKARERAELGLPHTTAAAFGIRAGWRELEPHQAELIRAACREVIAGRSLHSIAQEWNAKEVAPRRARHWTAVQVREVLVAPRLYGDRVYRGQIIGPGNWPAIIDRRTGERVREILLDPARRIPVSAPQRGLLSGLLRCGRCGGTLFASGEARRKIPIFCCHVPPRGCGRCVIGRDNATTTVVSAVLDRLQASEYGGSLRHGSADSDVVAWALDRHAEAVRRVVRDRFVDGSIDDDAFRTELEVLGADLDARCHPYIDRRRLGLGKVKNRRDLDARWAQMDAKGQRALIELVISHAVVQPRKSQGSRFDPTRLVIHWRDERPSSGRAAAWLTVTEAANHLAVPSTPRSSTATTRRSASGAPG